MGQPRAYHSGKTPRKLPALVGGIREVASHRSDVRVRLEDKTKEACNYYTLADAGKLFCTHFNDNGGDWDWDMIPGSVHVWVLLEALYYRLWHTPCGAIFK